MLRFTKEDNQLFSTRRLEALTDGVFAIAMTLLVLDLKVTDIGNITTSGQLLEGIGAMQSNLTSFLISFLLLGSMWAVHMRQFEYIIKTNRHLTMINTLRLLIVVLIPFTTSIAGTYSDIVLGRVLFPLNFFALAVVSYWQWRYAIAKQNKLYDTRLTEEQMGYADARNKAVVIIAGVVVVASLLIDQAAFMLFFFIPVVVKLVLRHTKISQKT